MAEDNKAKSQELYRNGIKTPLGYLFWTHIGKPDTKYGEKYKAAILIREQDRKKWGDFRKQCLELAKERWPKIDPKKVTLPFRKGDRKADKNPFLAGCDYINTASKNKPFLIGPGGSQDTIEPITLKWGNVGRLCLDLGTYELTETVKIREADGSMTEETHTVYGVTCFLNGVQKFTEGVPSKFGGKGGTNPATMDNDDVSDDLSGFEDEAPEEGGEPDIDAAAGNDDGDGDGWD